MKKAIYLNNQDYKLIIDILKEYIMSHYKWEEAYEIKLKIQEQWLKKQ